MLGYYKTHFLTLTKKLRDLEENQENLDLLIEIQFYILERILLTEDKIKQRKNTLKKLKFNLKNKRLSKEGAIKVKKKINLIKYRIPQYQWLLHIWRCFGDGIAFIYLDKWSIKPFLYNDKNPHVKQSAGSIKGKEGLNKELSLILDAKKNGVPSLLNDLTNTIRHGDVCLLGDSDPYVIEVKSSKNQNKRVERQIEAIKNLHDYLENDESNVNRGFPKLKRVELESPEVNYIELINEMFNTVLDKGAIKCSPEPGVHYIAMSTKKSVDLKTLLKGIEQGIAFDLNAIKNDGQWANYYPFILSIRDPKNLYAFLSGDIYLIVIFDIAVMKRLALEKGFLFTVLQDNDYAYKLVNCSKNSDEPEYFKVSRHFALRMAVEFHSLKWFFNERKLRIDPNLFIPTTAENKQ